MQGFIRISLFLFSGPYYSEKYDMFMLCSAGSKFENVYFFKYVSCAGFGFVM